MLSVYENFLKENGITFEKHEYGLRFDYQGGFFVIFYDDNDPQYLNLCMPNVLAVSEDDLAKAYFILNEINNNKKVIKATINKENAIWFSAELFVNKDPELKDFFFRLIGGMHQSRFQLLQRME